MTTQDPEPTVEEAAARPKRSPAPLASGAERLPPARPRRRAVMILLLLPALCGVILPVLLANDGRHLQRLSDRLGLQLSEWGYGRPAPPPIPARTAIASTPAPAKEKTVHERRPRIPAPAVSDAPTRLSPPATPMQPEKACQTLEPGATGERPVFLTAEDGRWECTVLIALSTKQPASALFVQMRGTGAGLSSLRMKLNFAGNGEDLMLVQRAEDVACEVLAPLQQDEVNYLRERMARRQPFWTQIGTYRITFREEGEGASRQAAAQRFNFIATSKKATVSGNAGPETLPASP